jgi:hypothetical protein
MHVLGIGPARVAFQLRDQIASGLEREESDAREASISVRASVAVRFGIIVVVMTAVVTLNLDWLAFLG